MTTEERSGAGRRTAVFIAVCGIVAATLGVVGALLGIIPGLREDDEACEGARATVSAPDRVYGATFTAVVTVTCPPAEGEKYALVAQVLNVDAPNNPHDEWYVPRILNKGTPGTYRQIGDLSRSVPGSERRLYLISVSAQRTTDLNEGSSEPLLQAPPGEIVSNQLLVTKG